MSNTIKIQNMEIQLTDKNGVPDGGKFFGFLIFNDYMSAYIDGYDTVEERNQAIELQNLEETIDSQVNADQISYIFETIDQYGGLELNGEWIPKEKFITEEGE